MKYCSIRIQEGSPKDSPESKMSALDSMQSANIDYVHSIWYIVE